MDDQETLQLINKLVSKIDRRLSHTVVIPEDELVAALSEDKQGDLATTIEKGVDFLLSAEVEETKAVSNAFELVEHMEAI